MNKGFVKRLLAGVLAVTLFATANPVGAYAEPYEEYEEENLEPASDDNCYVTISSSDFKSVKYVIADSDRDIDFSSSSSTSVVSGVFDEGNNYEVEIEVPKGSYLVFTEFIDLNDISVKGSVSVDGNKLSLIECGFNDSDIVYGYSLGEIRRNVYGVMATAVNYGVTITNEAGDLAQLFYMINKEAPLVDETVDETIKDKPILINGTPQVIEFVNRQAIISVPENYYLIITGNEDKNGVEGSGVISGDKVNKCKRKIVIDEVKNEYVLEDVYVIKKITEPITNVKAGRNFYDVKFSTSDDSLFKINYVISDKSNDDADNKLDISKSDIKTAFFSDLESSISVPENYYLYVIDITDKKGAKVEKITTNAEISLTDCGTLDGETLECYKIGQFPASLDDFTQVLVAKNTYQVTIDNSSDKAFKNVEYILSTKSENIIADAGDVLRSNFNAAGKVVIDVPENYYLIISNFNDYNGVGAKGDFSEESKYCGKLAGEKLYGYVIDSAGVYTLSQSNSDVTMVSDNSLKTLNYIISKDIIGTYASGDIKTLNFGSGNTINVPENYYLLIVDMTDKKDNNGHGYVSINGTELSLSDIGTVFGAQKDGYVVGPVFDALNVNVGAKNYDVTINTSGVSAVKYCIVSEGASTLPASDVVNVVNGKVTISVPEGAYLEITGITDDKNVESIGSLLISGVKQNTKVIGGKNVFEVGPMNGDKTKGLVLTKKTYTVNMTTAGSGSIRYAVVAPTELPYVEINIDDIKAATPNSDGIVTITGIPDNYEFIILDPASGYDYSYGNILVSLNGVDACTDYYGKILKNNADGSVSKTDFYGFGFTITDNIAEGLEVIFPEYHSVKVNSTTAGLIEYYTAFYDPSSGMYRLFEATPNIASFERKNSVTLYAPHNGYIIISKVTDLSGKSGISNLVVNGETVNTSDLLTRDGATISNAYLIGKVLNESTVCELSYNPVYNISVKTENVDSVNYVITKDLKNAYYTNPAPVVPGDDGVILIENIPGNYYVIFTDINRDIKYTNVLVNFKDVERTYSDSIGVFSGYSLGKINENVPGTKYSQDETFIKCSYFDPIAAADDKIRYIVEIIKDTDPVDPDNPNPDVYIYDETETATLTFLDGYKVKSVDRIDSYHVVPGKDLRLKIKYSKADLDAERVYARRYKVVDGVRVYNSELDEYELHLMENPNKEPSKENIWILDKEYIDSLIEDIYASLEPDEDDDDPDDIYGYDRIEISAVLKHKDKTISFISSTPFGNTTVDVAEYSVEDVEDEDTGEPIVTFDSDINKAIVKYNTSGIECYMEISSEQQDYYKLTNVSLSGNAELIVEDIDATSATFIINNVKSDIIISPVVEVIPALGTFNVDAKLVDEDDNEVDEVEVYPVFDTNDARFNKVDNVWEILPNKSTIRFTVTEEMPYEPTVKIDGNDSAKIVLLDVTETSKGSGKYKYTYLAYAVDIADNTVTIEDRIAKKDVDIVYNREHVYLETVYSGKSIFTPVNTSVVNDIETATYEVPYDCDLTVRVKAYENSKIKSTKVKHITVKLDRNGENKFKVNYDLTGDDAFIIDSSYKRAIEVVDKYDVVTPVRGIYEVAPNNFDYYAVIKEGNTKCMDLKGDDDHVINILAKVGNVDVYDKAIKKIDYVNNRIYMNFYDDSVVGKTVIVSVYENNKIAGTFKFAVSPFAVKASVTGEKNEIIDHEFLTKKSYKVKFSPNGVKADNIAIVTEYKDYADANKWKKVNTELAKYDEGILTINASQANLADYAPNKGFYDIRVKFYDKTRPGYDGISNVGWFATKELNIETFTLAKYMPGSKLSGASDVELYFSMPNPKLYDDYKNLFFYYIKYKTVEEEPISGYDDEGELYVPISLDNAKVIVSDLIEGNGKEVKYNVDIQLLCGIPQIDSPSGEIEKLTKVYGSSKILTLKKQSTKNDCYEKKIGATAKNNKLYSGQKMVKAAEAKYSAKTTRYGINAKLVRVIDRNTSYPVMASGLDGLSGLSVRNNMTVYIDDTSSLIPGEKYVLYIWPSQVELGDSPKMASVPVTVYNPIKTLGIDYDSSIIVKKVGVQATLKTKVIYNGGIRADAPHIKKVTYEIVGVDGHDEDFDITKYVTVNSSGVVNVRKDFVVDKKNPNNNKFKIVIKAADYKGNSVSKTSSVITIEAAK